MTFWIRTIDKRKCEKCGKVATVEVISPINEVQGRFCARCGGQEARRLNQRKEIEHSLRGYAQRVGL